MVDMKYEATPWRILIEIPMEDCPLRYYPANIIGCKDPENKSGECLWPKCQYRVGGC